ncbi:MAG: hypothetical protein IJE05_03950 [Clostridia bacterium]|nr:hypothetical protein [Clostridia bacterium]
MPTVDTANNPTNNNIFVFPLAVTLLEIAEYPGAINVRVAVLSSKSSYILPTLSVFVF